MTAGEAIQVGGIVGDTPDITARLQEAAKPDTAVVGENALKRALWFEHSFGAESLGRRQLKGVREPLVVYEVPAQ